MKDWIRRILKHEHLDLLGNLSEREERLYSTSVFLIKMLFAGLVFRGILFLNPDTFFLQEYLTHITQEILSFTGISLERQGNLLFSTNSSYIVTRDCLGWKSMAALAGLTFASSKKFLRHWKFLTVAIVLTAVLNVIRVVTTVYLSYNGIISFEIIHTVFWKWGLTVFVLGAWFLYFRFWAGRTQN